MAEDKEKTVVVVSTPEALRKMAAPEPPPAEDSGPKESVTEHVVRIDGVDVPYRAVAGTLEVRLEDPELPKGKLFYVAYTRTDVDDATTRPLTFCFNGGPGSSAVWLHLGCLGPRRIPGDVDDPPRVPVAIDNAFSILDKTDLVFVDPMSTGFSKPASGKGEDYLSVQGDVESIAEFIRRYTTKAGRWASPKFIAGESYGTTRAAAIAQHLQERHGLYLAGLVLVSLALKFQTLMFHEGNDLPFVLYVPGYAATALYHGVREAADRDAHMAQAKRWAFDTYAPALLRGAALSESERRRIAEELSRFIGVSTEFILRSNLRVDLGRFCRELLRDRTEVVGRLDSRFRAPAPDGVGENLEVDPSFPALQGRFTAAFHHELRHRLGVEGEELYEVLNMTAHKAWKWSHENQYIDQTKLLRRAMLDNPGMRVFVASGWFDLATTVTATEYTVDHLCLGLPEARARAMVHHRYWAGHMMYIHEPSLQAFRADLAAFYQG